MRAVSTGANGSLEEPVACELPGVPVAWQFLKFVGKS